MAVRAACSFAIVVYHLWYVASVTDDGYDVTFGLLPIERL